MYRVYDKKEKRFINENILVSPEGDIYKIKKKFFGLIESLCLVSNQRYILQNFTGLYDVNNKPLYEGDIVVLSRKSLLDECLLTYNQTQGSYILLSTTKLTYYSLSSYISEKYLTYKDVVFNTDIKDNIDKFKIRQEIK